MIDALLILASLREHNLGDGQSHRLCKASEAARQQPELAVQALFCHLPMTRACAVMVSNAVSRERASMMGRPVSPDSHNVAPHAGQPADGEPPMDLTTPQERPRHVCCDTSSTDSPSSDSWHDDAEVPSTSGRMDPLLHENPDRYTLFPVKYACCAP